jgi:methionine-rich copper-binding protein CopC
MIKSRGTFGLAVALTLGLTGQALAHAELKSATPPVNGTMTASPSELDLQFSEGVNLAFTGVEVKSPGRKAVATGKAALRAGDDTTLVIPLSGTLAPGTYTVAWHALSVDGHKTHGTYSFTVKP